MKNFSRLLAVVLLTSVGFVACKEDDEPEFCQAPAAPSVTNDSPKKYGETVTLTASGVDGAEYTWYNPKGEIVSTSSTATVALTGSNPEKGLGQYKVIAKVGECESPAVFTEVTSCDNVVATSNSPVISSTGTLQLSATTIAGATYAWTGPNNFTSNIQNPSIPAVTKEAAGTYTVVVTSASCTSAPKTVEVVIRPPAPTINGTTAVLSTKVGATFNLTASNIPGATYSWTGPSGWTSNQQNPVLTNVTKKMQGTYTVVAIVNGVESAPASKNLTVNYSNAGCLGETSVSYQGKNYTTVELSFATFKQCWLTENIVIGGTDVFYYNEAMATVVVGGPEGQGVCPDGWHVSTDLDWTELSNHNSVQLNGNALKAIGQGSGNGAGTNTSGLSVKFGASDPTTKYNSGTSQKASFFWTSTEKDLYNAWYRQLFSQNSMIYRGFYDKANSTAPANTSEPPISTFHVRCVKD